MSHSFFVFNKKEIIYVLALFILGLILGATLLNLIISQRIDKLILENNNLKARIQEQENQLKKQQPENYFYLNNIKIHLQTDVNKHKQLKINDTIHKLLGGLYGKDTRLLDPFLLRDIIHDRYIIAEGDTYHLELLFLFILNDELSIYVQVKKAENTKQEAE